MQVLSNSVKCTFLLLTEQKRASLLNHQDYSMPVVEKFGWPKQATPSLYLLSMCSEIIVKGGIFADIDKDL